MGRYRRLITSANLQDSDMLPSGREITAGFGVSIGRQHGPAQRYLIQALRLAQEADIEMMGGELRRRPPPRLCPNHLAALTPKAAD